MIIIQIEKMEIGYGIFTLRNRTRAKSKEQARNLRRCILLGANSEGNHNVANSLAASIAGKILKLSNESIRNSLTTFQAVEHRFPVRRGGLHPGEFHPALRQPVSHQAQ